MSPLGSRIALRAIRATMPSRRGATTAATHSVIASAAKQSDIFPQRQPGLLRCARNDGEDAAVHYSIIGTCLATSRGAVPSRRGSSAISIWRRNGRKPERW